MRAPTSRQGAQPDLDDLFDSLKSLLVASRLWARRQPLDEGAIDRAFDATVIALHARYVSTIPVIGKSPSAGASSASQTRPRSGATS